MEDDPFFTAVGMFKREYTPASAQFGHPTNALSDIGSAHYVSYAGSLAIVARLLRCASDEVVAAIFTAANLTSAVVHVAVEDDGIVNLQKEEKLENNMMSILVGSDSKVVASP